MGKTADELTAQRHEDPTNRDPKIQRQIESQLIKFTAMKRKEGLAPAQYFKYILLQSVPSSKSTTIR
jgi:hypothetical protein